MEVVTHNRFSLPLFNSYSVKKITKKFKQRHLKRLLISNKIEVVHTFYNAEACCNFLDLREEIPFRFVVRVAGMRPFEVMKKRPHFKKLYQRIFKEADLLNFISEGLYSMYSTKEDKLGTSLKKDKVFIKDIGMRLQNKNWTLNHVEDGFTCVMVSRFTKYAKRQDILVRAMALLPKTLNVKLTLVGSGKNTAAIQELIDSLHIASRVTIIDFLPQAQLHSLLLDASVVCHACDHEGLSKIVIESMGMGIPVLASDVAPLNTYIGDGNNGFLVANEPALWAKKIEGLYHSQEKLKEVSNRAVAFVKENYDATTNAAAYEKAFENLIS